MLNKSKIHFIGIGGISMSGLAEIMVTQGHVVSGSDMQSSDITKKLANLGVAISASHAKSNITPDIDIVVYTAAISEDNPELMEARRIVKSVLTRAEFLGHIMKTYDFSICVSGTHGKTTTTSMLANVLLGADKNPTITVGGIVDSIGGNIHIGDTKYFLTEACEYHNSFLDFNPKVGIILNVEEDHLDFFKDLEDIQNSFTKFSHLIPEDGFLVIEQKAHDACLKISNIKGVVETFSFDENSTWFAKNIVFDELAHASFDVYYKGNFVTNLTIGVTGMHNVLNALSVCAVCNFLNIPFDIVKEYLVDFSGAKRRFEIRGNIHGVTLVDDYAHHPTEIRATLETAKKFPHNELYIIFQPHTYTRTKAFLYDFADALSTYGHIILTDIYAAREKNPGDIHSMDIVNLLKQKGTDVTYIENFDEIADYLLATCVPNDVIIAMGAGNVNQIIDILLGE
ncbi:MAG: UDP-N-acetylmuramate--L-alanine ligase [Epulopiscium sp. Nuni2H_MBin003]|nr:MAG: UDP-N-acetylmuramate--L-alanine ligase [Epulopiscium sp. Nuni2H_MBin003]